MLLQAWGSLFWSRHRQGLQRRWLVAGSALLMVASLSLAGCAGATGRQALAGTRPSSTGVVHGMFVLDPPTGDANCTPQYPPSCYSQHLVPTLICSGPDTPAGYNCTQAGAGTPFIKGAAFHVSWASVNQADGNYDFSSADNRMRPWIDSGKLVSFVFEPASFGSLNKSTPPWYLTPVPISSVSQTAGIIRVQTLAVMNFFPGGASSAAGLEIQIAASGTRLDGDGTASNPGVWVVCDHNTAGCQDPSAQTIFAIGSGSNVAPVSAGTVGNPVYGSADGSTCTSGILPIQWRVNFQKAWKNLIQQAVEHYSSKSNVVYLRFGMGIGGQTNPTYGLAASDANQTRCQSQMTGFGFTSPTIGVPWPAPDSSQWTTQVSSTWVAYLKSMAQFEQSLSSPKAIILTISGIQFGPPDFNTADATAQNAMTAGIGFGNQGLNKSDPINFQSGNHCGGGDWCANFQKFRGQVPLELQTLSMSDPTDRSQMGSLAPGLLTFATGLGAQVLELYVDDWMCTYDSSWNGGNTYGACTAAGYPAVFAAAAAQIN